jgi:beta-mannosidase
LEKPEFSFSLSGNSITLSSSADAKYVNISFINNDALFSDNYFDLKKGETKTITYSNIKNAREILNKLRIKSLYDILNDQ